MGNESGTWIMYGVSREDPECIHTVDEAVEYINKVGFLPLFKNLNSVILNAKETDTFFCIVFYPKADGRRYKH